MVKMCQSEVSPQEHLKCSAGASLDRRVTGKPFRPQHASSPHRSGPPGLLLSLSVGHRAYRGEHRRVSQIQDSSDAHAVMHAMVANLFIFRMHGSYS